MIRKPVIMCDVGFIPLDFIGKDDMFYPMNVLIALGIFGTAVYLINQAINHRKR